MSVFLTRLLDELADEIYPEGRQFIDTDSATFHVRKEWANKLRAIRAAVGGEAVGFVTGDGFAGLYQKGKPSPGSKLYASPPATVDVGALRGLSERWRNESNAKYPRGTAAREMAPEERYEIEGRCEQLDTCADELAALIGEKA